MELKKKLSCWFGLSGEYVILECSCDAWFIVYGDQLHKVEVQRIKNQGLEEIAKMLQEIRELLFSLRLLVRLLKWGNQKEESIC